MALRIKKQIKNSDGTITEIEGTEAEVESFIRKHQKRNESPESKKKNLILGKEAVELVESLIKHYISIHELTKRHGTDFDSVVNHHYYYRYGGYWYYPYWFNGGLTWRYTNTDPTIAGAAVTWCAANSLNDLASSVGATDTKSLFDSFSTGGVLATNGVVSFNGNSAGGVNTAEWLKSYDTNISAGSASGVRYGDAINGQWELKSTSNNSAAGGAITNTVCKN